jgi:hypothetical protein
MNTFRLLAIICFLSALAGCQQEYSGDVGGASVQTNLDFGNYNAEGARLVLAVQQSPLSLKKFL